MNKLRVRVVLSSDKMSRIQVSQDGLVWFTIWSEPDGVKAIEDAKAIATLSANCVAIPTHILWKSKTT